MKANHSPASWVDEARSLPQIETIARPENTKLRFVVEGAEGRPGETVLHRRLWEDGTLPVTGPATTVEANLIKDQLSRSIVLDAPNGTGPGALRFSWSLLEGDPDADARYSYWQWPDKEIPGDRRFSSGYRSWKNMDLDAEIEGAYKDLWSAWRDGAADPEGEVMRRRQLARLFKITGAEPFTTVRQETFTPEQVIITWTLSEDGDHTKDFGTVDLCPAGRLPAWNASTWARSFGKDYEGNDAMPDWLRRLADACLSDLRDLEPAMKGEASC